MTQVNATPHALRLSARWGVDLKKVRGSGRGIVSLFLIWKARSLPPAVAWPLRRPRSSQQAPRSHADDSQVSATPLARRLAGKLGINLHDCRSSGSRGRVSRDDVLAAALLLDEHPQTSPVQESAPAPFESIPMSGMRRAIASRLQRPSNSLPISV
ncbi:dihydrolipoamide acetyltransferase component of pyruvate dehydrogenase complex [Klebsiella pneumoniae]|uniref:Dihydrolipoamide acetyltransferase component of pyruvate dehydrogenase complex n=1 Tax=Klebsiella pneumoniae TaxID=573 RepID=A0A2X3ENH1_KLEPN|nr:dihydrolipoamide acetyltransferase component of pyruvate dehydrogenase complex [Klebsiella pneumoniae]